MGSKAWNCVILTVYLSSFINLATGISCLICSYNYANTPKEYEACLGADPKYSGLCPPGSTVCLTVSGLIKGKASGVRQCSPLSQGFIQQIGGSNQCLPESSPHFLGLGYQVEGRHVPLQNGTVCVCDSNNCNRQERSFADPNVADPGQARAAAARQGRIQAIISVTVALLGYFISSISTVVIKYSLH